MQSLETPMIDIYRTQAVSQTLHASDSAAAMVITAPGTVGCAVLC
jgi:hypothetical protein